MHIQIFRYCLATCVAAVGAAALAQTDQNTPVKVGLIVSATGPAAVLGTTARTGALLAAKEINAKGGINGRPLELLVRDDATNPDSALTHANDLVRAEKVSAVIVLGPTASSIAVGGVTHAARIPQFSLSGMGPTIERERTCVVHLAWTQDVNARAFLGYASAVGQKKMAVLYDSGWGTLVYNELKRLAPTSGIELVAAEKFDQGSTDTTTQVAKIKATRPDVIAVIANTAVPYRDIRRLQMEQPVIGAATAASYETVKAMGPAADNIIIPEYIVAEQPLPRQKAFVDLYNKEYKALPKGPAIIGWDGVQAAADLIKRGGPAATGERLCGMIRTKFPGVSFDYDFAADDLNGLKPSQMIFTKLVKGEFQPIAVRVSD
jgi:branched-chain amino acid transport system substrate-binding protein